MYRFFFEQKALGRPCLVFHWLIRMDAGRERLAVRADDIAEIVNAERNREPSRNILFAREQGMSELRRSARN
jgi:hypothetical protein